MRKIAVLLVIGLAGLGAFAQSEDPVVIKLGKEEIRFSEFRNKFAKNNDLSKVSAEELRNFVDLYVTFRLKYAEAAAARLDTIASLREELDDYREQIAASCLTDKEVSSRIFEEAVERMQWDIRASHILKKVQMEAVPADTLAAYNAVMALRQRILKGEAFGDAAAKESDDPSAKDKKSAGGDVMQQGNRGDLGYFTAFDMLYSFESGAYNTQVGSLSMPIRSELGYHLVFVHDKRPAFGKCKATQIVIPFNKSPNLTPSERAKDAEQTLRKINDISNEVKNGLPFEDAVEKYGEGGTNGKLPLFGCNRFEGDFVKELYGLKEGEISKPIKTSYGYHLVKIDELVPVRTDEEAKSSIHTKILQDSRSFKSRESFIERVKKENGFKEIEDKKAKTTPVQDFYTALDSNIFNGTYEKSMVKHLTRPMFVFAQKNYTQQDFAQYLEQHPFTNVKDVALPVLVNFAYKRFIDNTVMDYEESQLEVKNSQFVDLMRDYKEGIMLYELNERRIWKNPENDSIGLENFYQTVKNSHLYPLRVKAEYFKFKANESTAFKLLSMLDKNAPADKIMGKMNKKATNLVLDTVVYWQGQNKKFDATIMDWYKISSNKTYMGMGPGDAECEAVRILEIIQPSPQPLSEIRGLVISEYQKKLEEEWMKSLYDKPIWVDYETIISLCKKK